MNRSRLAFASFQNQLLVQPNFRPSYPERSAVWEDINLLQEGGGVELVSAIREARRALVFISVPWSAPERMARQEFWSAAAMLEEKHADLRIACFRLDVDENEVHQRWLTSAGYPEFAIMGAGSLLWLQSGRVLATESNALSVGALGIVTRSTSLWTNVAESAIEPN